VNFNVYLDDATAKRLERVAKRKRKPRNAIIREAVHAWLEREGPAWPEAVLLFQGDPKLKPFEEHRDDLGPVVDDPFA